MFSALFFGDFLLGKTKRKLPRAWAAQAHGLQRKNATGLQSKQAQPS
jgi:hypothetical protein